MMMARVPVLRPPIMICIRLQRKALFIPLWDRKPLNSGTHSLLCMENIIHIYLGPGLCGLAIMMSPRSMDDDSVGEAVVKTAKQIT